MTLRALGSDLAGGLRETVADLAAPWRRQAPLAARDAPAGLSHLIACRQFRAQIQAFPANVWAASAGVLLWMAVLWHFDLDARGLIWVACTLACLGWMSLFLRRFRRARPSDAELPAWAARCGRMNQAMNLIWGCVCFVLPPGMDGMGPYVGLALLLVIAGGLNLYVLYRPSIAWAVPCASLAVLHLVRQGGPLNLLMGVGMLASTLLLMRLARLQNALMTQSMVLAEERLALLAEVQRQRAAAQQANDAKTRFLAMVGHDLRQPMHSIALLTGALGQRPRTDDATVKQIAASVAAMGGMLDALRELDDARAPPPPRMPDRDDRTNRDRP